MSLTSISIKDNNSSSSKGKEPPPSPTTITSIGGSELLVQIFNNISVQLAPIEQELGAAAATTKIDEIKDLHRFISLIKSNATNISSYTSKISEDSALLGKVDKNLKMSGVTLRHVNRVSALIDEIENELLNEGEFDYFRILADLFGNLVAEMTPFDCYVALPHIKLIKSKVLAIEAELGRQCQHHVREIGQLVHGDAEVNPNSPGPEVNVDQETIGQLYLVVDVLGLAFRKDLCGRIAQLQLIPYEKAFKFGTKFCGIEHIEKRFVWFRILLKVFASKLGQIFPKKWCLPHYFFIEFSRRTKKHIEEYLAHQEKEQGGDIQDRVHAMLLSLKSLISFEAEMKATFANYMKGQDIDASILDMKEPMAEAYDPYLGPYIQVERMDLEALMEKINNDEQRIMNLHNQSDSSEDVAPDLTIPQPAFESSQKMFEFIKASLKRCNTFSSGVTYLALSKEFRICLHNYALSLKFRHPSPVSAKAGERPVYEMSNYMEVQLCRLIKTGEYCIDTIPQLEERMKEHIDEEFKSEITFTEEVDIFQAMITDTIALINTAIVEKIYPLLGKQGMRSIDWSKLEGKGQSDSVKDESAYMKAIFAILNDTIPRIRINLSNVYFQQFYMKLASALLDVLLENIWKLKRIGGEASNQLLIDLKSFETYLLNITKVGIPAEELENVSVSKVYSNIVAKMTKKIEVVLKLVAIEDSKFDSMFKIMWPDATPEDYKAVESLRVIKLTNVGKVISGGINDTVGELKLASSNLLNKVVKKKQPEAEVAPVLPSRGKGKFRFKDGSTYVGEFVNGKSEGSGHWKNQSGDVYDGEWKDGYFHGMGIYRYKNGNLYDGEYKEGKMTVGTFIYKSGPVAGNIYEGEWQGGMMHGKGIYRINSGSTSGNTYEGGFVSGKFQGKGVYRYKNGDVYEGEYLSGMKHGPGLLKAAGGAVVKQVWANGVQQ